MKFRIKMTLCMVGILSLLFGVGGSVLISLSFQNTMEQEKLGAYRSYQMTLGTLQLVSELEPSAGYDGIIHTLEQLDAQNGVSWSALRLYADGESIYGSGTALDAMASLRSQPRPGYCLLQVVPDGGPGRALIISGEISVGKNSAYLHAAYDISPVFEAREAQLLAFRWIFAGMAVLCALLSYVVSRRLTAPLTELSQATRSVASGNYSVRVGLRSHDEIGTVTDDFNVMAQRLEAVVAELRESVERQERFLGSFAHELKTPMTSIIGYAELLSNGALTPAEQEEAARYIFSEGKRLENLSRKLLELLSVKKSGLALQPVRPAQLLTDMAEEQASVYQRFGITLASQGEDGVCLLEPDLIRSLLLNLMDNARKAMDGGGQIELTSQMTPEGCRLQVRDDGRGIPPEELDRLTEPFYRVDKSRSREQGGVGLGLSLCREIAAFHGGELSFDSVPGQGTCVTVELRGGRA